jgi:hypothetical protein
MPCRSSHTTNDEPTASELQPTPEARVTGAPPASGIFRMLEGVLPDVPLAQYTLLSSTATQEIRPPAGGETTVEAVPPPRGVRIRLQSVATQ